MTAFYMDIDTKLNQIFFDHCSLTGEQYKETRSRMISIEADAQDGEDIEDIQDSADELNVIFDFMLHAKMITDEEYNGLCNMINGAMDEIRMLREMEEI